jgi:hypothetical protein
MAVRKQHAWTHFITVTSATTFLLIKSANFRFIGFLAAALGRCLYAQAGRRRNLRKTLIKSTEDTEGHRKGILTFVFRVKTGFIRFLDTGEIWKAGRQERKRPLRNPMDEAEEEKFQRRDAETRRKIMPPPNFLDTG